MPARYSRVEQPGGWESDLRLLNFTRSNARPFVDGSANKDSFRRRDLSSEHHVVMMVLCEGRSDKRI